MPILIVILILFYHFFYTEFWASYAALFFKFKKRMRYLENFATHTSNFVFQQAKTRVGLEANIEQSDVSFPPQFVVVSNHQGILDIYTILQLFPRIRFIAKKELSRGIPGVSSILRYGRHCFVDRRSNYRKTYGDITLFTSLCAREKFNIHIFPEGTRSRDGKLGDFNSGAYRVIQDKLMLPTIVVAFDGEWAYSHISDLFRKAHKFSYNVKVLAVLPPPTNKKEIMSRLEDSRLIIEEQLTKWRS